VVPWQSAPGSHLPENLLWNAFSIHGEKLRRSDLTALVVQISALKKHVVIFADEIHSLYLWDDGSAIDQFFQIGSGTDGIIWSIISGSAAVTRDLCFCLLPQDKEKEYPGYKEQSLNDSRYKPLMLQTINKKEPFRELIKFILKVDFTKTVASKRVAECALEEDSELELLYLASRGVFRGLNHTLTDPSRVIKIQISVILETIKKNPTAEILFNVFGERWNEDIWDLPCVSSAELPHFFPNGNPLSELYRLCDSSYFQAVSDNYSTSFYPGHPLLLKCWAKQSAVLTPYEQICLQYPFGGLGIDAEKLVLRSMVANGQNQFTNKP
jgi:hypothetical protein